MSTMTVSAPLARPRRVHVPTRRPQPAAPLRRPVTRALPRSEPLRLTARGRAVLLIVLLALGLAVSFDTGAVSLAGTSSAPVPVRYVTVGSGQTLWSIAGEVAPQADRRDTVAQIIELNAMPSSGVQAGQQIAVPATAVPAAR